MSKPTDIRVVDANISFDPCPLRMPLKFGGRVMSDSRLVNVEFTVENGRGEHATGFGSMPVGNLWAWPSRVVDPEQTEQAMMDFAERTLKLYGLIPDLGHPVDLVYYVSAEYGHLGKIVSETMGLPEPVPPLAQLVAASPIDAALHDAFGRVNAVNSYNALSDEFMNHDLSEYLDDQFSGESLDRYILHEPQERMPLYHLVGALDPLTEADMEEPVGDGLPETLSQWIAADGLTHFKIKLNGDDLEGDVGRVIAVDAVVSEAQAARRHDTWYYSTDFNEQCENEEYLLDFLTRLQERRPQAYDRIQYIEQPTHRDLKSHPQNTMHRAAARKPVVIDESLVDYEALLLAREQGYSGVALKACKGHTEALFAAAAAQKFGMLLCVQDLTCPGYSFLHSASLAARVPTVAGIEGNSRQYCPQPNKKWARQFPSMFEITDGTVGTGVLTGIGLGF